MASMSTPKRKDVLNEALKAIPSNFRKHILRTYRDLKTRHTEGKYDASGLSAGKFCESVLRFLQQHLTGTCIAFGTAVPNFPNECAKLLGLPKTSGNESLRVVIPRTLSFIYTLRNKRGIGHVGGDVDANRLDSHVIATASDWIVCELIRVFHNLSLEEAQDLVDSVSTRQISDIWEVSGRKRVLRTDLDFKDKTLLLLYSSVDQGALVEDLFLWTKYSNIHMFRRAVLEALDKECLVDYDAQTQFVTISPLGIKRVEDSIIKRGM
jgi:hypothetical protein